LSYSLDVNVLLYASDESSPLHEKARAFLDARAEDPEMLGLSWSTLTTYLRIATHPAIFRRPLDPAAAQANVDALLRLPQVRPLAEQDGFWDVYLEITRDQAVRGNLVPDAHLAAILRQNGIRTIYSRDAGFRRFPFLRVVDPFLA
jgi:toxin-antitoxin system PIN domain toxin